MNASDVLCLHDNYGIKTNTHIVVEQSFTAVVIFNSARLFRYGEERQDDVVAYIAGSVPQPAVG